MNILCSDELRPACLCHLQLRELATAGVDKTNGMKHELVSEPSN
jgi:hypothetical protein